MIKLVELSEHRSCAVTTHARRRPSLPSKLNRVASLYPRQAQASEYLFILLNV